MLRENKEEIGWSLADIKGMQPSMCIHRILLEGDSKNLVDAKRCLNLTMKEAFWKKVMKWLDVWVIYPISDSLWVSLVQVVPEKTRTIVVKNENNKLMPTRTVTRWRICID